ncbi:MAG TPA: hypothetical protein DGG94_16025 [Micromonosporaceae bacterium]|nr:hypothetical protein [Micromonosporaceae bacterium]HCU51277.1 hypothetical protein [Micromonosporaceae bacterium]
MTTRFANRGRARHEARPGRRALVAPDLTELHGPTSGIVELPHRLFWYPDRHFNLDDPAYLQWMYQIVLREAVTIEELRAWINGDLLTRLWPNLHLPRAVRRAWEERHQILRSTRPHAVS